MLKADLFTPRPTLTSPGLLARALDALGRAADSKEELWRRLTESYAVDLDAVAALLPTSEPEPVWLRVRD